MMQLPVITMQARAVRDAELRFSQSGVPVAKVRCVASARRKNKQTDEWEDGDRFWVDVTAFNRLAENVAESVTQGMLINVVGRIMTDEWEDKDGNKRSAPKIIADSVSLALDWDPAKVTKVERSSGSSRTEPERASADPWASRDTEEPPF